MFFPRQSTTHGSSSVEKLLGGPPQQRSLREQSTMNRTFTFEGFNRASTTFGRTITGVFGLVQEDGNESAWMRGVVDDYIRAQTKGIDGDVPLPGGFAREARFWKVAVVSLLLGLFMGLFGLCFLNMTDEPPSRWTNNQDFSNPDSFNVYSGQLYWIAIPTAAGLFLGMFRYFTSYPENVAGLFKEINSCHVDYRTSPSTCLMSIISLACGAALGPEFALGNLGGGLATFLSEQEQVFGFEDDDKKLVVLAGMAAAIGALFPSPLLTVMMMFELGKPPRSLIESVTVMGIASVSAFMVNYSLLGDTYLHYLSPNLFLFTAEWKYENKHCFTGFLIGLVGACLNFIFIILIGVTKQFFMRLKLRFELKNLKFLANVIPQTIGGLIIGVTNYCLPISVGNGNLILAPVVQMGYKNEIPVSMLIGGAFARGVLLTVSMNCGFTGGFIFPMMTIGVMAGTITHMQYSYLPMGIVSGTGLFARLQAKAKEQEEIIAMQKYTNEHPEEAMRLSEQHQQQQEQQKADQLSLNKYLEGSHAQAAPLLA